MDQILQILLRMTALAALGGRSVVNCAVRLLRRRYRGQVCIRRRSKELAACPFLPIWGLFYRLVLSCVLPRARGHGAAGLGQRLGSSGPRLLAVYRSRRAPYVDAWLT